MSNEAYYTTWDKQLEADAVPAIMLMSRYEAAGCSWWISGDGHTGYTAGCTTENGRYEAYSVDSLYAAACMAHVEAQEAIRRRGTGPESESSAAPVTMDSLDSATPSDE